MTELVGFWHKVKRRCDFCGTANPNGNTFVINSEEISGCFCGERHAKAALSEMRTGTLTDGEHDADI